MMNPTYKPTAFAGRGAAPRPVMGAELRVWIGMDASPEATSISLAERWRV
jgi:hypothetical protein